MRRLAVAVLTVVLGAACGQSPVPTKKEARTLETPREATSVVGVVVDAPVEAVSTPHVSAPHPLAAAAIERRGAQRSDSTSSPTFGAGTGSRLEAVTEESACTPHWGNVHGDLDRCIAGDGEGCVGIGDEYRKGCDAFSSIKWYLRGCRLGNGAACSALSAIGEVASLSHETESR
jgi:hypothetical protein